MASAYPAAYSPRTPQSNIPYAGVSTAPTYPYPPHNGYDASAASLDSSDSDDRDPRHKGGGPLPSKETNGWERGRPAVAAVDIRSVNRTPSPTPEEAKELAKTGVFDWNAMMKWRYWIRREWLCAYLSISPRTEIYPRVNVQGTTWRLPSPWQAASSLLSTTSRSSPG